MPFTPSHIAAVLPFARTPLAPAALAIGSMAPDIPYFVPGDIAREFTHSLHGAVSIDLAIGLLAFVSWLFVLRQPVLDYAPGWVRERMPARPRWRARNAALTGALLVAALEIGILTHLLLDEFTHEGGWLDSIAPWAGAQVGTFVAANLIHAVVSIALGLVLARWVRRWVQRTPREPRMTRLTNRGRRTTWIGLTAVLAAVGASWWLVSIGAGEPPLDPDLLGHSFFVGAGVTGAVGLALALVWHLRKAR